MKQKAPTDKQVELIRQLFVERTGDFYGNTMAERVAAADQVIADFDRHDASKFIDWFLTYGAQPRNSHPPIS